MGTSGPRTRVFVTTGIEDALAQAREAADGKAVSIMGGPTVATQYLRAGLVDEVSIHLVPVLFGAGTRLTETLPAHIELELADLVSAPSATHHRYRIKRAS
jgi:dihydrofolate reductase